MVIATAVAILSKIMITRTIGPDGMGVYALVILIPTLAFSLGNMGTNVSNIYLVGSRKFDIELIVGTSLVCAIGMGFIMVVVVSVWSCFSYDMLFGSASTAQAVLCISAIPLFYVQNNLLTILQGKNYITQYNAITLSSAILMLTILAVLRIASLLNLTTVLATWFLSSLFNTTFVLYKVSRFTKIILALSRHVFLAQLSYGLRAYIANLTGFMVRRIDVLLVMRMLGTTELGYYSISFGVCELLLYLASSVSTALIPYVAASEAEDSKAVTAAILRVTVWTTGSLCLILPLFDRFFITTVFGSAFSPSVTPLRWLLPGILCYAMEKTLAADLAGRGRPEVTMVSGILALIVNVIANLILIPKLGISGAAMASSAAYAAAAFLTLGWFLRITHCTMSQSLVLKKSDVRFALSLVFRVWNGVLQKCRSL